MNNNVNPEIKEGLNPSISCVVHGSFRKNLELIKEVCENFRSNGINVLAPNIRSVTSEENGFVKFKGEENLNPLLIELEYLSKVIKLNDSIGFSYFINPKGIIGNNARIEATFAISRGIPCFFSDEPIDFILPVPKSRIISQEVLAEYIKTNNKLPPLNFSKNENLIYASLMKLQQIKTNVAAGALTIYNQGGNYESQILLVNTDVWKDFDTSIIGRRLYTNEGFESAVKRGLLEEVGILAEKIKPFSFSEQLPSTIYTKNSTLNFVDFIAEVDNKKFDISSGEVKSAFWLPITEIQSIKGLEPNARKVINEYIISYQG